MLLADGATGTNLFAAGLTAGDPPDLWNIERPELIAGHYRSFVEAGADVILTNTFGANAPRLKLHNAQDRVFEINKAGAELARAVADAPPPRCRRGLDWTNRRALRSARAMTRTMPSPRSPNRRED